jgi:glycerophosphoryl diester phosphodiesterase
MPRPEIIAHRGTPRVHPENSLPGFTHALALGVDGIELDVHLTLDGVPVVHHDPELAAGPARLAGRPIVGLTLDELRTYELAPGVPVPTLAEALALTAGRTTLYVEVKAREAGQVVADLLGPDGRRTPVHSFDHRLSRGVRLRAPGIPVGVLSVSYLVDAVGAMRAADARDLWQHWSMIDAPLVDAVHAAGGRVIAWTVNDPARAVALAQWGVDGICSDVPDLVARALDHPAA